MSSLLTTSSTSSSSSSASTVSNGRYWGLASGLDVDSIVTGLVADKQTQIDKANQSKQLLQWKQTAYQSVISSLTTFSSTYLDIMASGSLTSSKTFTVYSASSSNSAVTATATSASTAAAHTMTVTQNAVAGSLTGSQLPVSVKSSALTADSLKNLAGTSLKVTVDGVTKTVAIDSDDVSDVNTFASSLQSKINSALGSTGSTSDKVKVTVNADNSITIGASDNYQSAVVSVSTTGSSVSGTVSFSATLANTDETARTAAIKTSFDGTSFDMTVNGTTKTISFSDGDDYSDLGKLIQNKVDEAFGKDSSGNSIVNVTVGSSGKVNFASNGSDAPSISFAKGSGEKSTLDVLGITDGTSVADALTGLGIASGQSNRADTNATLSTLFGNAITSDASGNFSISINGTSIALNVNDSLSATLSKIGASGAGVTATLSSTTGKVTILSNTTGASTTIKTSDSSGFLTALEGGAVTSTVAGQDAEFTLDGTKYSRSTNNFTIDGVTYQINGTITSPTNATISMTSDVSSAVKAITDFVNAYNTLITSINTQISTKPDSNYAPLTDTQKSSMKDSDITSWNTKAQQGILFGDDTLNSMLTSMRSMLYQSVTTSSGQSISLYQIGISESSDYLSGGTLVIDTDKLTTALQNDASDVQQLFTKTSSTYYQIDGGSAQTTRKNEEGLGFRLQDIIKDYTQTGVYPYVGSLVAIAGTSSDTSTDYELNKELKDINDQITEYTQQMTDKKNALYNKFTQLETFMEEMNSQSSMLSSFASSGS